VGVAERVRDLAEPLAAEQGLVLIDVEFRAQRRGAVLRCTLDRAGGITLGDIERFHRALDPLLDAAAPIASSYVLEVSSPGAERPLRTPRDFELFAGRPVALAAREPVDGRREWHGRLLGLDGGCAVVAFGADEAERVAVPLPLVAWARLRVPL
jgi:ribosome maturation factor RimP